MLLRIFAINRNYMKYTYPIFAIITVAALLFSGFAIPNAGAAQSNAVTPTYTGDGTYTLSIGDTIQVDNGFVVKYADIQENDDTIISYPPSPYQVKFNITTEAEKSPTPMMWLRLHKPNDYAVMQSYTSYEQEIKIGVRKFTTSNLSSDIKETTVTVEFVSSLKVPGLPDLTIEDFTYTQKPDPNSPNSMAVYLDFYVVNNGTATPKDNFYVVGKNLTMKQGVFELPLGGTGFYPGYRSRQTMTEWLNSTLVEGKNEIEISIDPANKIEESDKSNNIYTTVINAEDTRKPDLTIDKIKTTYNNSDKDYYIVTEVRNFSATAKNITIAMEVTDIDTGKIYHGSIYDDMLLENEKHEITMEEPMEFKIENVYNLRAVVDPNDLISEAHEGSWNTMEQTLNAFYPYAQPVGAPPSVKNYGEDGVTIEWETNLAIKSMAYYRKIDDLGFDYKKVESNEQPTTKHKITITGLDKGTKYYFYVTSLDTQNHLFPSQAVEKTIGEVNNVIKIPEEPSKPLEETQLSFVINNPHGTPPPATPYTGSKENTVEPTQETSKTTNNNTDFAEVQKLRERIQKLELKISDLERKLIDKEKALTKTIDEKLTERLTGKILLQVEEHGEAWYVAPVTGERFYLKDGATAHSALQAFGLGITNKDLAQIPVGIEKRAEIMDADGDGADDKLEEALGTDINNPDSDNDGANDGAEIINGSNPLGAGKTSINASLANRLEGKILLQVEAGGQAWYMHSGKRYYMKDGQQAYQIMRFLSLGITNNDLRKIGVGEFE